MFLKTEPTNEVAKSLLDDFSDVNGLKEVVVAVLALKDSEVYDGLVYGTEDDLRVNSGNFDDPSDLVRLASVNMSKFPLSIPLAPLITAKFVLVVYTFVYDLYSFRVGREFTLEELNNIFHGDMATRILLLLEDFDSNLETPKLTDEFFKRLGKVKWQDKKAKKLFNGIYKIKFMLILNNWKGVGTRGSTFRVTENAFLLLLSGCSAVLNGRDRIGVDDVVRANRTYLKLIDTDISEMV